MPFRLVSVPRCASRHQCNGGRASIVALAFALIALLWPAGSAEAQSLLDHIFGLGLAKPQPTITVRPPQARTTISPAIFAVERARPVGAFSGSGEASGGTYRTVCVRMCDGFYVPMSFATRRDHFQLDQAKCRATCGDDAKLFFHRNPGAGIEDAVDVMGHTYSRLPNAFRFRKTRVEGCSCRPPPWSEAELARHQSYTAVAVLPVPAKSAPAPAVKLAAAELTSPPQSLVGTATEPIPSLSLRPEKPAVKAKSPSKPVVRPRDGRTSAPMFAKAPVPGKTQIAAANSGGGLFGLGASNGMGLSGKPKHVWPGD